MIDFACITPHPPIIIPGIGRPEDLAMVPETVAAMQRLGEEISLIDPDVIVIISPHAPIEPYFFSINSAHSLEGSLADFGMNQAVSFKNDSEIIDRIKYSTEMNTETFVHTHSSPLDHGALVPLFYLAKNIRPLLVHLSFSFLSLQAHYDYGEIIGRILKSESKKIAIIASGDLSHRLIPDAPAGYSPRGEEFDRTLIQMLSQKDIKGILNLKNDFIEEAGECGLRSIIMLLGMIKSKPYRFKKLSYECPFGVGYLTAKLT